MIPQTTVEHTADLLGDIFRRGLSEIVTGDLQKVMRSEVVGPPVVEVEALGANPLSIHRRSRVRITLTIEHHPW